MLGWLRLRGIACGYFIPLRLRYAYSRPGDIERYPAEFSLNRMTLSRASSIALTATLAFHAIVQLVHRGSAS